MGIGIAIVVLGVCSAGIGSAAAVGAGLTIGSTTTLGFTGTVMAGAIAGGITGGGMAYIQGNNVVKGILVGAAIGGAMAGANYIIGQWSGYSKDMSEIINKDGTTAASLPSGGGRFGTNGINTPRGDIPGIIKSEGYDGFLYNPSHGLCADLVESVQEFLFGPGTWSQSAAPVLDQAAATGSVYHFIAHSQGGLQFGQTLGLMRNHFSAGSSVHLMWRNSMMPSVCYLPL